MFGPNLKFVALPIPEITAIAVLGGGNEPPILGKWRPYRGRGWYSSKER